MRNHIAQVHERQRDHNCESCGKSFFDIFKLKTHIQTVHEGKRDYQCVTCGKSFSTKGHMKRHNSSVHGGQKITNVNLVPNCFLKLGV